MYFKHQRDGQFWRRSQSTPAPASAKSKFLLLNRGLLDGYRDFHIPRMGVGCGGQVIAPGESPQSARGITPFPKRREPGPQIDGEIKLSLRLVGLLLQSRNTGIMEEPPLSIYNIRSGTLPILIYNPAGKWRGELAGPPRT